MENLAKAIIAVMQEVKGIEKTMTIGSGQNSYKGVPDQEVKKVIGDSMAKNGLCLLPLEVNATERIDRWEVEYNGTKQQKQSVFVSATTKYLLLHTSGESQVVSGYGNGIDTQDKGAGKATTYALKYLLLYLFLVPTGKIDDADNTHSDNIPTPQKKVELTKATDVAVGKLIDKIKLGEVVDVEAYKKVMAFTDSQLLLINNAIGK